MVPARVTLLGRPAVAHEGTWTPFRNERRFQLLAYLAVAGDWVGRDRLVALLWPDLDEGKARRNLRKIVFQAREPAWAAALETEGDSVRWSVDTDLAAFRLAVQGGQLADACAIYRGPLLEGMDDSANGAYSGWLDTQRAALQRQWRDVALAALPNLSSAQDRAATARRLVNDEPADERALLAALAVLRADGHAIEAQGLLRDHLRHLAEELGAQPSAAVLAAARVVAEPLTGASRSTPASLERNRRASDAFVGRRGERRELLALLAQPPGRVITIVGPGGIGKSRFARELLPDLVALTQADVLWVVMEDLHTAPQLLARIAQLLGAKVNDASDLAAQIAAQRSRHAALLVLDNAEHLPELASWLQPLLSAWPLLRLVLTSRARVGLADETLLPLQGLALPDAESRDAEAAAAFDAVRLFELRARRAHPGFELAEHLDAVITLLEMVDGLPLAIEMAADWVRLLPPAAIVRELERSIDILQRDRSAGQHAAGRVSMQAVLRRSWDLLAEPEQRALKALTVFRGGFRSDAAAAVADAGWPVLTSLVDRSMLTLDDQGRFGMHPLVAQWVADAVPAAERQALALRHAEFFGNWLRGLARDNATHMRPLAQAMEVEHTNCEAAWWAALAAERADLLDAMHPAWARFGESQGGWRANLAMFSAALACDAVTRALPSLHLDLQLALVVLHFRLGEMDPYHAVARAALSLARRIGTKRQLTKALTSVGISLELRGDVAASLDVCNEAIEHARDSGDRYLLGTSLHNAANVRKLPGQLPERLALNEEALAVMREIGHHDGEALTLNALGDTLHQSGNLARAREVYETGLRLSEERGLRTRQEIFRLSLGHLLIDLGQHAAARVLLERAVGDAQLSGQFHVEMYGQLRLARLDREEGHPTSSLQRVREVFQRARSRGFEGMALEALVLHAELHAEHGDAAYAQQLRAWLAQAPALPESQRERLRGRLAAADPAAPATGPPAGFDITVATQRLAAPLPSAAESPIMNGSAPPPGPAVPTTAQRRAALPSSEPQR